MIKKHFLLFCLIFSILCSLVSCEETPSSNSVCGAFYVENGVSQNTLVQVIVNEEELTAPLKELSYEIHNRTDFDVWIKGGAILEIYREGTWENAPTSDGIIVDGAVLGRRLAAHSQNAYTEYFNIDGAEGKARYACLSDGLYRLKFECQFCENDISALNGTAFWLLSYFEVS